MTRKRFTERQVIEALIRTGNTVRCFRTKEVITLESVKRLEREHPTPIALGGADNPTNAAYSLSEAHKVQTNGKPATSYGSDKHAIAKVARILADKPSDRPLMQKADNIRAKHFGLGAKKRPWSNFRKKMNGEVVAK
jgi:hypothetical protein